MIIFFDYVASLLPSPAISSVPIYIRLCYLAEYKERVLSRDSTNNLTMRFFIT